MDFGQGALDGANGFDFLSWYMNIPVISRLYLTSAFLTTAACAIDLVTPFSLYFSLDLIVKGQIWRLVTTFLFFGVFSIDFLFHMYFLVRYSRLLEEGDFRGRRAHFLYMILFSVMIMIVVAPFTKGVHFLGSALTFMMTYVWGRRNESVRMSFLGVFTFTAPYLPWVMLGFSLLLGNPITIDAIGIFVGHIYYFLEYVYPVLADIRGWKVKRILEPPKVLHWICGTYHEEVDHDHQD